MYQAAVLPLLCLQLHATGVLTCMREGGSFLCFRCVRRRYRSIGVTGQLGSQP